MNTIHTYNNNEQVPAEITTLAEMVTNKKLTQWIYCQTVLTINYFRTPRNLGIGISKKGDMYEIEVKRIIRAVRFNIEEELVDKKLLSLVELADYLNLF